MSNRSARGHRAVTGGNDYAFWIFVAGCAAGFGRGCRSCAGGCVRSMRGDERWGARSRRRSGCWWRTWSPFTRRSLRTKWLSGWLGDADVSGDEAVANAAADERDASAAVDAQPAVGGGISADDSADAVAAGHESRGERLGNQQVEANKIPSGEASRGHSEKTSTDRRTPSCLSIGDSASVGNHRIRWSCKSFEPLSRTTMPQ